VERIAEIRLRALDELTPKARERMEMTALAQPALRAGAGAARRPGFAIRRGISARPHNRAA
jgi:hypothetical protein